jgi:N-acetylglucosamine-6-phosphate deacetylase
MPNLVIRNATVLTPFKRLEGHDVRIEEGVIRAVHPAVGNADLEIDATGMLLAPAFIDLQVNGAFGCDFTAAAERVWEAASQLPRFGVAGFLPTIITSPQGSIARAQAVLQAGPPADFRGARPLGLHIEGPFLNPERKGAHPGQYLRSPSIGEVTGLLPEQGISLVTLAPELPGALEVTRELTGRGVVVSAGHTMATCEQAWGAFEAGISCATHLFNAMAPLHQFEPGLVGAVLSKKDFRFGLIVDGIHVHPALVNLAWRLTGPGQLMLVSDAIEALGMPPGVYRLGDDRPITVAGGAARLADGVLAGSVLSPDMALRNLIAFTGCSLGEALTCLTTTPAALLGLSGQMGGVAPGYRADLVLLTPDLQVIMTLVGGERFEVR